MIMDILQKNEKLLNNKLEIKWDKLSTKTPEAYPKAQNVS